MNLDREPKEPSLDMVMHLGLGVVFLATVCAFVEWPLLIAAV